MSTQHQCPECEFIYDDKLGDSFSGYPAGTPFAELPDDYNCPHCCVRDKPDFIALTADQAAPSE
jgi:rubredoxin